MARLSDSAQTLLSGIDPDLYLTNDAVGERYAVDWSGENACKPPLVFRPRNAADVARIVQLCRAAGQRLVVQGGLTGLSGGATPAPGEWSVSTERMDGITDLDCDAKTITVGAGTPLQTIQEAADAAGLVFPLDLGARGSCVAGGLVSTNAGGNQVVQHGMARALVLGLEAVLADGTVIASDNKLLKNNAGFDLKQLFIGTEGTLGIVTRVTFRLFAKKTARPTALCALPDFASVVALLNHLERRLSVISAFELMWADYYHESLRATSSRDPFDEKWRYYVLFETEGGDIQSCHEQLESALAAALEDGLLPDAAIAKSESETAAFWTIRDGVSELIPEMSPVATFDVGIHISHMEGFVDQTRVALHDAFDTCSVLVFGHMADGNLHLLVSTGDGADLHRIYDTVYDITRQAGGTITAEHGIGVTKKDWLHFCRSAEEIALMRRLKDALDPDGILNRGRVI